ncbi:MAG: Gx transporter family protein [bacterium]|nr:Gx transporter family protein [bacterium]
MKNDKATGKKVAYLGIFASLAILCGYIETLIPFPFGIPGMKLGLANIMTVTILYLFGTKEAAAVSAVRILVVSMLFGSLYSMLYSLAGAVLSLIMMLLMKKVKRFSITGVSISGGIAHNIGQIFVAVLVVSEIRLTSYIPFLIISGAVTGLLNGIISGILVQRLQNTGMTNGVEGYL